jgi:hypothetical protein
MVSEHRAYHLTAVRAPLQHDEFRFTAEQLVQAN